MRETYPTHARAPLLQCKGLHAGTTAPLPQSVGTPKFVQEAAGHFRKLAPLHHWLMERVGEA